MTASLDAADRLIDDFSRHIVALCVHYRRVTDGVVTGEAQIEQYPGVFAHLQGHHVFLTAGHSLQGLSEAIDAGAIVVDTVVLFDGFGPSAMTPAAIPFDLHGSVQLYVDDEAAGIDFGMVRLSPYYVRLLGAQGVQSLTERNFASPDDEFWQYFMLGLPDERVFIENLQVRMELALIPVIAVATPVGHETRLSRFTGTISSERPFASIVGMSGGPVFGVKRGAPCEYKLIGIQSRWFEPTDHIFATPVALVEALIAQHVVDAEFSSDGASGTHQPEGEAHST